jgi:hypothetical protein
MDPGFWVMEPGFSASKVVKSNRFCISGAVLLEYGVGH